MDRLNKSIKYWYMRYLMVTELFMVERWEQNLFHIISCIFLVLLGVFNHLFIVGGVRFVRQLCMYYTSSQPVDMLGKSIDFEHDL